MADFNKTVDLDKGLNKILEKIDSKAEELRQRGEDAGEAFGDGWDDGFDYTVEKIKASSIKAEKAFKNLSDKIRKQVQQLTTTVNGKDFKLKIDFSDIDMNSDVIQQKIVKMVKDFSTEGLIEFDTKGSEQQFKNLMTLYVKYQEKFNSLQGVAPNLTSAKEIEVNLRQQLMLALKLKEIYSFLDNPDLMKGYSMEVKKIADQLVTVQKVVKQTQGGDTKVTNDYSELSKVLKEIQSSLKIISDTFNKENGSMKAMAEGGVTSFESLSQAIVGVYNNLVQVQNLVDSISKKDFNITNITQTGGTIAPANSLTEFKQQAQETVEVLNHAKQLADEVTKVINKIPSEKATQNAFNTLGDFYSVDLDKEVSKSKSATKLAALQVELENYIKSFSQILKLVDNSWKDMYVPKEKPIVKPASQPKAQVTTTPTTTQPQNTVATTNAEAQQMYQLKAAIDEVTNAIGRKNAGFVKEAEIVNTSVSAEEAKLRELVVVITTEVGKALDDIKTKLTQSFVMPEINKSELQESLDGVYKQFVELKDNIETIKFDVVPNPTTDNVDNTSTTEQTAIDQIISETKPSEVKITPTMDEGAVAKVVADNVANTPATVKVTPVADSASDSEQAMDTEGQEAVDVAKQFVNAANAKKEFVEANKQVAKSAEESASAIEKEANEAKSAAVDIGNAALVNEELAQITQTTVDGKMSSHGETYKSTTDSAKVTRTTTTKTKTGKNGSTTQTVIETMTHDIEAFKKEAKQAEADINKLNAKLKTFLNNFKSKTGQKGQFVKGFKELELFKDNITVDNMNKVADMMTTLQGEYGKLEASFRQGQTSLNPFTNAITKASNMDNIFGDVEYKFNSLVNKSEELTNKFEELQTLSQSIKAFIDDININPNSITPESFSEFAKQVGRFNELKNQIDGEISREKRVESDDERAFKRLVNAAKARDSYSEKSAKEEDSSVWKSYYADRAAEQQALIEAIRSGLTLTEAQEAQLNAMAEKHALILRDINLENNQVEEQKQKYEEIMRLLEQNHANQVGLDSGSLKVVDKNAYQQRLDVERAQINDLIKGANLDPQQTKSIEQFVKLISSLKLESSNIDLMSKKWMEQNILTDEAKSKIEALKQSLLKVTSGSELDAWKTEWKELANEMSMAKIDAKEDKKIGKLIEDDRIAQVEKYINLLKIQQDYEKKAAKEDEGSKMQSFYYEQIAKVKEKIEAIDIKDIANQEEMNRLLALEESHQRAIAEIEERKVATQQNKQGKEFDKQLFISQDKKIQDKFDAGYLSKGQYDNWQKELIEYQNYMNGIAKADENVIQNKKQSLMQLYDMLTKMSNASKSFFASGGEILPKEMWFDKAQIDDMSASLTKLYNNIVAERFEGMTTSITRVQSEMGKLTFTVDDGSGSLAQYTIHANKATGAVKLLEGSVKPTLTVFQRFGQSLKKDFTGLLTALMGGSGIHTFVQYMRKGVQSIRELDAALTELKKVTDETEEVYDRFLGTASQTSARIGSTLSDVTSATAEFAKLGYNISEASAMAESALVYTNVGDNVDVETGSQSIISTMKAFGIEADNTMAIVDKFNEVGELIAPR